jgi:predicted dehydrogenase
MTKSEDKMKIGIVGAGAVTKDLHLPVLVNMPTVQLKWICDKNGQRARRLAKLFKIPAVFTDVEQCSDVDIVLIAIPVGYRHAVMVKVFQQGWHIFCEKPFAVTLDEYDQYLTKAKEKSVQVGVGLVRRYSPATITAKKFVREGLFGPIVEVWANEGMITKRTGQEAGWYMGDPQISGGGVLMETGTHLVDQLCTITDVNGFSLDKCVQRTFNGLEFETRFIGALSTSQQADIKCSFEVSRLADLCNGIFIQFSKFILKCGLFFEDSLELLTLNGDFVVRFETDEGAKTIGQAFFLEWQDFVSQCKSGDPSAVSADTARHSASIIEQCYKYASLVEIPDNNIEVIGNG